MAALEMITGNGVRTIIVETANRFARDLIVQETGWKRLHADGITLIAADAPEQFIDDTPTAVLIRQILGAVAQFDKAMTVAKLRALGSANGRRKCSASPTPLRRGSRRQAFCIFSKTEIPSSTVGAPLPEVRRTSTRGARMRLRSWPVYCIASWSRSRVQCSMAAVWRQSPGYKRDGNRLRVPFRDHCAISAKYKN
jgi:hypothetical protein